MPACPGTSPQPPSSTPALQLAASDGEHLPATRADPDRPPSYVPAPAMVLDQQSFDPSVPNVARVYDHLLGGCFLYAH
jgi:hypothetical protein